MKRHYSKRNIAYRSFTNIFLALFLILSTCLEIDEFDNVIGFNFYMLIGIIVIYIGLIIYNYFYYKTSQYELTAKEIKCQRGVFFKKKSIVDYTKMHAINKRQNIIQRIFKIAVLTVDSGSTNTASSAEILIIEEQSVVDKLINELRCYQSGKEIPVETNESKDDIEISYKFNSKMKWLYSLILILNTLFVGFIIILFFNLGFNIVNIVSRFADNEIITFVLFLSLILLTFFMVLMFIGGIIFAFIGYYDFKIYKQNENLEISYGLLVKNHNTFALEKIKAIKINQNIINRIFGFVSINIEVIGYNAQPNEDQKNGANIGGGVLIPLCKLKEVTMYLDKILPEYIPLDKAEKPKSFNPFYMWPVFIYTLVFVLISILPIPYFTYFKEISPKLLLYIYLGVVILYLSILIIIIIGCLLEYKTASVNVDDNKVTVYTGGWLKNITTIQKKNLIAIETITTPLRFKRGIVSYVIHFRSNALTNTVRVKNLSIDKLEKLNNLITY